MDDAEKEEVHLLFPINGVILPAGSILPSSAAKAKSSKKPSEMQAMAESSQPLASPATPSLTLISGPLYFRSEFQLELWLTGYFQLLNYKILLTSLWNYSIHY